MKKAYVLVLLSALSALTVVLAGCDEDTYYPPTTTTTPTIMDVVDTNQASVEVPEGSMLLGTVLVAGALVFIAKK